MGMEIFRLLGTIAISKDKALKDIKAIQDQAKKASTAMGKSFTKFSGYVEKHSAQIKKAGKYLTVFGGIATAAFALSVKSAAAFEEQLANVSTMLDESAMKILPEYREGLQSLSVDFGESTETLSKGLYDILSASIPPAEAMGVLEISAKAAAAGITDTGVAADAITTILNSYGMSADQAGVVSDKLFAVVKEGKTCITGESRILLSDGRYERIDSLRNGAEVLSWTGKNFIPMQATFHALEKKKIIRIRTAFGREIRTTAEHPYLTPDGWKEVQELRIGDKIAIPSSLPVFGNLEPKWKSFPKLLGYLISEGHICRGTPIISSSSKEIINDIRNIVSDIGLKTSLNKKRSGNVNIGIVTHLGPGNTGENPLANELKRLGIQGSKSKTKFVPKEVFEWKPKYILEFLEGLFNGDGWFRKLKQKNSYIPQREIIRNENGRFRNIRYKKIGSREVKRFQIGYSSASKQLIFDVSHLLLRFGINGAISYGQNNYDGIYSWVTSRFSEISQFVSLINLKRDTVQEFKSYKQISHQLRDISSGIYFARIKSKVEEPEEEVYDLTVPIFHNFVANDIVAHNTFAELAPSIGKVAATASMAGLSFDDLGACIATMTRAGIRTEETMTAINGVLIAFLKPTDEAIEAAAKFGLELNTTTLQTLGMTGVMEKLTNATAEQLAAIFPNIRGLKGMAAALGDAEGYARSYALMLDSAGLTQEAFEKQSGTLNFVLKQLKSMFEILKVTVGDALAPAVKDITEKVMGVLKRVKEWTEANKPLTETLVKWAAGISVLMLVLGPLLIVLPSLVSGITLLATVSLPALATAFAPFLIGGIVFVGITKFCSKLEDMRYQARKFQEEAKAWTAETIAAAIKAVKDEIADLLEKMKTASAEVKGFGGILGIQKDLTLEYASRINDLRVTLKALEEIQKELFGTTEEVIEVTKESVAATEERLQVEREMQKLQVEIVKANKNLRTFMEPVKKIIEEITEVLTPYEQKIIAVNTKYDDMIETIKESGAAQEEITAAIEDANIARDEQLRILAEEKTAYDKLIELQKTAKDIMAGVIDKIFEFTRSPYEVKLRDINREYDGYIEKIKKAKLGTEEEKIAIDDINYARDLDIQRLNAEIDATKGLSLEMQILTAQYKLAMTGLSDYDEIQKLTLEYYQDMLEAAEKIVEVKKAERDALEEGTIEWDAAHLAYREAQIVVKDLEETIDELNKVKSKELEGLELTRAKLEVQSAQYRVITKDADYYKDRIELLGEEHEILAEKIEELKGKGEEWTDELVKLKREYYANEEATEELKEELIKLAEGMSDAELEASGLIPILEALGIELDKLAKTDFEKAMKSWDEFISSLKPTWTSVIGDLIDIVQRFLNTVEDAFSDAIHSFLTMAETNAKILEDMAEAEADHLEELAELQEDYQQMVSDGVEELAKLQEDYHDDVAEAEKDHLDEVTKLQEDYQQMILDGMEELTREKENYYDKLAGLELDYNRKMSDGIKALARENEDYDIEMGRLKKEYHIAVMEGDDKAAKNAKENMEDCTLAHERAVEDMEEKQGELTEDHGIKMDKMEENHKNAMDEMIKKQGEEAQNALDKIAEVKADHEELIAKMEEEHKLAMDAMIKKQDEEAQNALDNIQDVKEDHAELMEGMEDDMVTTQSIAETFWEALKTAGVNAIAAIISKLVWQVALYLLSLGPVGWAILLGVGILGALWLQAQAQAKALGGEVAKFVSGGLIKGLQAGGGTDSVLIKATPGEYVVSKPMTDFIKRTGIVTSDLINAIRMGARTPTPSFAVGGTVPSIISNPISNQVNIEGISVSIFAQELNDETIANAGDKMFVELKRQFDMRGLVLMEG